MGATDSSLASLHRRLGAVGGAGSEEGDSPLHYGDAEAECRALRAGCGLCERFGAALVEVAGADRRRFLNGLVTCDVKNLVAGQGTYGFATDARGRILADLVVMDPEERSSCSEAAGEPDPADTTRAAGDSLWLDLPASVAEPLVAHFEKYRVADRVDLSRDSGRVSLALAGPGAAGVLAATGAPPDDVAAGPWQPRWFRLGGGEALAFPDARFGVPAWSLWVEAAAAPALIEALLALPGSPLPVGFEALEAVRMEAGVPHFGRDFGPENFPQETGLEGAVSYTKGCYLGQEIVARIHYRGKVNRALRGLLLPGAAPPSGTPIVYQGEEVGRLTSAARSPALGRAIGLSILHLKAGEPGTRVEVEGAGEAEVVSLPFPSPA